MSRSDGVSADGAEQHPVDTAPNNEDGWSGTRGAVTERTTSPRAPTAPEPDPRDGALQSHSKWQWLIPESQRAAGCSCLTHREKCRLVMGRAPGEVAEPARRLFTPTHTEAELVQAERDHKTHFASHVAKEIHALHKKDGYNGLRLAGGTGLVTVRHITTRLEQPYSPCGNLSQWGHFLSSLYFETQLVNEEMQALGLATEVEYGPSVARAHVPAVRWDRRNHRDQGEPLRRVVCCLLLIEHRLTRTDRFWLPVDTWLVIFGFWCSADFYR